MWLVGGGSWATFCELVDMLPADSMYSVALQNDDELAEYMLQNEEKESIQVARRPPLKGWTTLRSDLAEIKDLLIQLIMRDSGGTPISVPRPETALDRARKNQRKQNTDFILDLVRIQQ